MTCMYRLSSAPSYCVAELGIGKSPWYIWKGLAKALKLVASPFSTERRLAMKRTVPHAAKPEVAASTTVERRQTLVLGCCSRTSSLGVSEEYRIILDATAVPTIG
mmetsp:Transcript_71639/g.180804  ORF Transcript_71639/g.180804 Transcript_71639/m.180804 type:complete len:105 (+) Transcript_71639:1601-1915(+)